VPRFSAFGEGVDRKLPAGSAHLRRLDIGGWEAFMPEASSFLIFLRATIPQVQSPDTGEG
jgi:hypothetical protein